MMSYPSPDPMKNRFSVRAFRFLYSVPGVTNETNVIVRVSASVCCVKAIMQTNPVFLSITQETPVCMSKAGLFFQCFAVVCTDDDSASTRCSQGCISSSGRRERFTENLTLNRYVNDFYSKGGNGVYYTLKILSKETYVCVSSVSLYSVLYSFLSITRFVHLRLLAGGPRGYFRSECNTTSCRNEAP